MFVLDEADEMLSRGFKDQIYEIFQKQCANIQVRISCIHKTVEMFNAEPFCINRTLL